MTCRSFTALIVALLGLLTTVSLAHAQEIASLSDLKGDWTSTDPAFGAPAASSLSWTPVLNGKFYRLDYQINRAGDDGNVPIFQGVAFYREKEDGTLEAFWADSGGDLLPINADSDGTALIANWGTDGSKQGTTRYELTTDGTLMVTDKILMDGDWREFNRSTFHRAP